MGGSDASVGGESGQSGAGGGSAGGSSGRAGAGGRAAGGTSSGGTAGKGTGGQGTGGATGTAGVSGTTGSGGMEPGDAGDGSVGCDESKSPAVESCLVSDDHAVFVAKGFLNGNGTKESPSGSIADGMLQAKSSHKTRIIVCNATYVESVSIESTAGALSIYGGFTCPVASGDAGADWTPTPGVHALVAPGTGVPLKITGATAKITRIRYRLHRR